MLDCSTVQAVHLPVLVVESMTSESDFTEETTETTVVSDTGTSSSADTGVFLGVLLAPFFIIIFLISVILVLALKKG